MSILVHAGPQKKGAEREPETIRARMKEEKEEEEKVKKYLLPDMAQSWSFPVIRLANGVVLQLASNFLPTD